MSEEQQLLYVLGTLQNSIWTLPDCQRFCCVPVNRIRLQFYIRPCLQDIPLRAPMVFR